MKANNERTKGNMAWKHGLFWQDSRFFWRDENGKMKNEK